MLKHIRNTALILLGFSYGVAGLTLIATFTPGGITLGLLMLGLAVVIYFLWNITRALLQIRELLMLSVTREHSRSMVGGFYQSDEEENIPTRATDANADSPELYPDS